MRERERERERESFTSLYFSRFSFLDNLAPFVKIDKIV